MSDHQYSQSITTAGTIILKDGQMMTVEDIVSTLTRLQSEVERLRGRCGELESAVDTLRYRIVCSMDDKRVAARNWPDDGVDEMLTRSASEDQGVLTETDYAQRPRQQAAEIEQ